MWDLIHNNLKIFIDPLFFADRSIETISKQVNLVNTLKNYLKQTTPKLCDVTFFFPRYVEERFGIKRSFLPNDSIEFVDTPPKEVIEIIKEPKSEENLNALQSLIRTHNEYITLAIENKCAFILTTYDYHKDIKIDLRDKYGLEFVNLEELHIAIEQFLQGFFNYFKFRNPIYGIKAPDIAHAMTEKFFKEVLIPLETEIRKNNPSEETSERIRSFVHNRYIDILTTVDYIGFFKLEQRIFDIENEDLNNKKPHLHGHIRYYINYYLFLLWGAIDHLSWIINDILCLGYDPNNFNDQRKVGLKNTDKKQDFLIKIKLLDEDLYNYIVSEPFQEWLYFFGQLRHLNAHREMFSASPLLITTEESKISDKEIDDIIYKGKSVFDEETIESIKKIMGEEIFLQMEENQKIIDRNDYRISKMKKGLDYFAEVKKSGEKFILDPIARIPIDLKNLKKLIELVFHAYKKIKTKE
jgi:hypothetical protein